MHDPPKDLYKNIHRFIQNRQPINKLVYPHREMPLCNKRNKTLMSNTMAKFQKHYVEWKKLDAKYTYCMSPFIQSSKIDDLRYKKWEQWLPLGVEVFWTDTVYQDRVVGYIYPKCIIKIWAFQHMWILHQKGTEINNSNNNSREKGGGKR